jgi:carbonic anhydrase
LSCADSRIAPEYAFDSSRGDLFVCRVACNFVNADNLASFEFAVDALKFPLLLVLRHEACGAIKATMSSVQDGVALPGHLPSLVAALAPAVIDEPGDLLVKATRENVRRNVCAVTRRRFPVGASPTRQPLQPEATGAVMEVTKWLKPSV